MVKPLVLEYPEDPTTRAIDTEYLFCDALLVAPVFREGGRRQLYLPQGQWMDWWDGTIIEGPQVDRGGLPWGITQCCGWTGNRKSVSFGETNYHEGITDWRTRSWTKVSHPS